MTTYTPAERCAASICWLARFQAQRPSKAVDTGYWHRASCRFCEMPDDRLRELVDQPLDESACQAFSQLDRKARQARVREAQEVPWWEQLS